MVDVAPFVASQRLLLLDSSVDDPRRFLQPERFRAPVRSEKQPQRQDNTPTDHVDHDDARYWSPRTRDQAFFDDDIRRLCLTTEAGIGKTTTLEWVEARQGAAVSGQLALLLPMHELPDSVSQLATGESSVLVSVFLQ